MRLALIILAAGLFVAVLYGGWLSGKNAGVHAATENAGGPVVLELFTSQSCSSCPIADKLLGDLAKMDNVIALSCHVTYWNHLHWEDTLSQEFCTQRQRSYAGQMKGGRVYTPQLVVNGAQDHVGSRKSQIHRTIKSAALNSTLKRIGVSKDENAVMLDLPALDKGQGYIVSVFQYIKGHDQHIASGENRGRDVHYTHSVTALSRISGWSGEQVQKSINLKDAPTEGVAVIVQSKNGGPVIAAGELAL